MRDPKNSVHMSPQNLLKVCGILCQWRPLSSFPAGFSALQNPSRESARMEGDLLLRLMQNHLTPQVLEIIQRKKTVNLFEYLNGFTGQTDIKAFVGSSFWSISNAVVNFIVLYEKCSVWLFFFI